MSRGYIRETSGNKTIYQLEDLLVIGSELSCNIFIKDEECEVRHARIEHNDGRYIIRDLRTKAGTFVNNTKIVEALLQEGDEIQIGQKSFVFSTTAENEKLPAELKSKNLLWAHQLKSILSVAKTDYPVLVLGPSGSGKEIISQALHDNSYRKLEAFVSVNCSALTETLVESELFGHVKGSFTGALTDRKGAFEAARGGTLFLDEIGDLPYSLQAKLLRALENNEIRPVGSDRIVKTNVRIIAATHQNLQEKVQKGEFRSDLYFRLNVVSIQTPALADRMEDFEDLLFNFARKMRVRFSYAAVEKLKLHNWPGNIRELRNVVARASAMFPQQSIEPSHLEKIVDKIKLVEEACPPQVVAQANQIIRSIEHGVANGTSIIKEIEKQMIEQRLILNFGNQRRTAADLGIPKSTLHDRLKYYKIDPKAYMRR